MTATQRARELMRHILLRVDQADDVIRCSYNEEAFLSACNAALTQAYAQGRRDAVAELTMAKTTKAKEEA